MAGQKTNHRLALPGWEVRDLLKPGSRREFFRRGLEWILGLSFAALSWVYLDWRHDAPRQVILPELPAAGEVTAHDGVFLVSLPQGVLAFDARCPHLGCSLRFTAADQRFHCPCHGSTFLRDGTYVTGPARKDMVHLDILWDEKKRHYRTTLPAR